MRPATKRYFMKIARQEAAQAWCGKKTSKKEMDADLAKEFAKIIFKYKAENYELQ
jgi:hypothetical protein